MEKKFELKKLRVRLSTVTILRKTKKTAQMSRILNKWGSEAAHEIAYPYFCRAQCCARPDFRPTIFDENTVHTNIGLNIVWGTVADEEQTA